MTKRTDTKPLRGELDRKAAPEDLQTIYDLLDRQAVDLAKALPKAVSFDRFTRTVLAELRRSPELLECLPQSLLGSMLLAAQLGLEPGPLGLVYFVPDGGLVEFVIGYRGYIDLAYRSGQVKDLAASVVYEGEAFDYRKGTRPFLDHSPGPSDDPRETVAAYAVARLRSGGTVFEVIYRADWEAARKASPTGSAQGSPWVEQPRAMIRKTAVRRLAPMLPQSPLLVQAAGRDDAYAPEPSELTDSAAAL